MKYLHVSNKAANTKPMRLLLPWSNSQSSSYQAFRKMYDDKHLFRPKIYGGICVEEQTKEIDWRLLNHCVFHRRGCISANSLPFSISTFPGKDRKCPKIEVWTTKSEDNRRHNVLCRIIYLIHSSVCKKQRWVVYGNYGTTRPVGMTFLIFEEVNKRWSNIRCSPFYEICNNLKI